MKSLTDYITDLELIAGIRRVALAAEENEELKLLAHKLAALLYGEGGPQSFWEHYTPHMEDVSRLLGADADCYLAYVYDLGFPHLAEIYKKCGFPERVLAATLSDFDLRAQNYRAMHHRAGIDDYKWLTGHVTGTLFRLGRLQFVYDKRFSYAARIYRSRVDGALAVVAESGLPVDEAGFITVPETAAFTTGLEAGEDSVAANKIDAHGNILEERAVLPYSRYELLLQPGDPVIDIHIPATGKMGHEECMASFQEAWAFGRQFFPDVAYRGFVCSSWLLSDEVLETLPDSSNVVWFSRLFTRCAGRRSEHELIYKWIFGMDKNRQDYKSHEAATTLQKGTHRLLDQGRWYVGRSGFVPAARVAGAEAAEADRQ